MALWKKVSPLEKEWTKLEDKELKYLNKRLEKKDFRLNQLLEEKIPENLQNTLDIAFFKAFTLIFEKGTGVIEKTYKKEELEKDFKINEYTASLRENKKSLKVFYKKAASSSNLNLVLSGVSGVGLGVLGIGLPDIVLFTGFMLKSIYEIALNYGFDYEKEEEKKFILLIIRGAMSYGEELWEINEALNVFMHTGRFLESADGLGNDFESITLSKMTSETAGCLSKELLYMKFLQGIPVVGVVGGAYDAIYMQKIVEYAKIKYQRRFLLKRIEDK